MTTHEPLAQALARAASRAVGESKVGVRKGSVAAVARAMEERGVTISKNTLSRKLAGEYPLNTDEIGALCAVIGVEPDAVWRDALRIMREDSPVEPDATTSELLGGMSERQRRKVTGVRGPEPPPVSSERPLNRRKSS